MKKFFSAAVWILLIVGVIAFSGYAYNAVEAKRLVSRSEEIEKLSKEMELQKAAFAKQINESSERRKKFHELMLAMFPARQEDVTAVYKGIYEPQVAPVEGETATVTVETAPAEPSPVVENAPTKEGL